MPCHSDFRAVLVPRRFERATRRGGQPCGLFGEMAFGAPSDPPIDFVDLSFRPDRRRVGVKDPGGPTGGAPVVWLNSGMSGRLRDYDQACALPSIGRDGAGGQTYGGVASDPRPNYALGPRSLWATGSGRLTSVRIGSIRRVKLARS